MSNTQSNKKAQPKFDMTKGSVWKVFNRIWSGTMIAMIIAGTFVVFDTMFAANGFHNGAAFNMAKGSDFDLQKGNSWFLWNSETGFIGAMGLTYVMPYTFIVVGLGQMIGGGLAQRLTKAQAAGDKAEQERLMNLWVPLVMYVGTITAAILILLGRNLIIMASGFQKEFYHVYGDSWHIAYGTGDAARPMDVSAGLVHGGWDLLLNQATQYIWIQALGAPGYMMMVSGAILVRVEGRAEKAIHFSSASLAFNILLDFIFINVLAGNLAGAAIATVIAQYIAGSLYVKWFTRKSAFRVTNLKFWDFKLAASEFKNTWQEGYTIFLMQFLMTILLLSVTMAIGIRNYDDMYSIQISQSAFQGYFSSYSFSSLLIAGTAQSVQPVAQANASAGKWDRVRRVRTFGYRIVFWWGLFITLLMVIRPQSATELAGLNEFQTGVRLTEAQIATLHKGDYDAHVTVTLENKVTVDLPKYLFSTSELEEFFKKGGDHTLIFSRGAQEFNVFYKNITEVQGINNEVIRDNFYVSGTLGYEYGEAIIRILYLSFLPSIMIIFLPAYFVIVGKQKEARIISAWKAMLMFVTLLAFAWIPSGKTINPPANVDALRNLFGKVGDEYLIANGINIWLFVGVFAVEVGALFYMIPQIRDEKRTMDAKVAAMPQPSAEL